MLISKKLESVALLRSMLQDKNQCLLYYIPHKFNLSRRQYLSPIFHFISATLFLSGMWSNIRCASLLRKMLFKICQFPSKDHNGYC